MSEFSSTSTPLVSVMAPCHNAAASLPLAIASLRAQTYAHWECLLIDDGSTDETARVIAEIQDSRVRVIQLEKNRGRPAARQTALDAARGEFITSVDADDWIYPEKFARQVDVLRSEPLLAGVGTGMMIADSLGQPHGVRACGLRDDSLRELQVQGVSLPIAQAPLMIRMELCRPIRYDLRLGRSQDYDFNLQALAGRRIGLINGAYYTYCELGAMTYEKIREGLTNASLIYRKYLWSHPWASRRQLALNHLRRLVYWSAHTAGCFPWLIRQRSNSLRTAEIDDYWTAYKEVKSHLACSATVAEPACTVESS